MTCELENRMVMDELWLQRERFPEVHEKMNGPGYEEIGTGLFVPEEDAYDYAMERVSSDEGMRKEFVEWFYSGNWVKEVEYE